MARCRPRHHPDAQLETVLGFLNCPAGLTPVGFDPFQAR